MYTTQNTTSAPSKGLLWTGRVLTGLVALLFLFSASGKLSHMKGLEEGFTHLGIPVTHALGLGILELGCVLIYLFPRTAVLGAILLTGYLGGAIQTHIRIGEPVYTHVLFGILTWGGVFLRFPALRSVLPFTK